MAPRQTRRRRATKRTYKRRVNRKSLYRVARRVAYQIAETKYYETGVVTPDITSNGLWSAQSGDAAHLSQNVWARLDLLNGILVGNTNSTRVGNRIMVKYVQVYLAIGQGDATDLESGTCRFLLIRDKGTQGSLIDMRNSYFSTNGPMLSGQTMPINAPKNSDTLRRYSTLLDRQHSVQMYGSTAGSKTATPVMTFYIPVNRVFTYKAGSSGWNSSDCMVEETLQFALGADMAGCCNISAYFRVAYKDA